MDIFRFRKFPVYQLAREFRKELKEYSKVHFPKVERFILINQLWRAMDFIIFVILLYYLSEAWRVGFWVILASFFAFFLSLLTALSGYSLAAEFLRNYFSLARSLSTALGFLIIAGVSEG